MLNESLKGSVPWGPKEAIVAQVHEAAEQTGGRQFILGDALGLSGYWMRI